MLHGVNRMTSDILGSLILNPTMDAIGISGAITLNANRWIVLEHINADGIVEEQPQHLQQIVCCIGSIGSLSHDVLDVATFEMSNPLLAMLLSQPFQNVTPKRLCGWLQPKKVRGAIIGNHQCIKRTGFGSFCSNVAGCLAVQPFQGCRILAHEIL